jgi:hypothetical protein
MATERQREIRRRRKRRDKKLKAAIRVARKGKKKRGVTASAGAPRGV